MAVAAAPPTATDRPLTSTGAAASVEASVNVAGAEPVAARAAASRSAQVAVTAAPASARSFSAALKFSSSASMRPR